LWARGFEQDFSTTGGWGIRCGSAGQRSQAAAGRAQQSSVRALPHACRRSSGEVRVLNVRIDWHVKRPTNKKVKHRAVQSQAGEGLARRREQIECTQLQLFVGGGFMVWFEQRCTCGPHRVPHEYTRCGGTERFGTTLGQLD